MQLAKSAITVALAAILIGATAPDSLADVITFDEAAISGLTHGRVIDSQYFASEGVTVSAQNPNRCHDLAIIFDSEFTGWTSDTDLLGPPWASGNLAQGPGSVVLGNLLIISEHNDGNGDGIVNNPDDEGSRPDAGSLFFEFEEPIVEFGFDLVDVEGAAEITASTGYFAAFYLDGVLVDQVSFADFITPGSGYYDPTVAYGNNSANRITPITSAQLGVVNFDKVEVNFGGSAGIDNLRWEHEGPPQEPVPEPGTSALFGLGMLGLVQRSRRKRAAAKKAG